MQSTVRSGVARQVVDQSRFWNMFYLESDIIKRQLLFTEDDILS